MSVRKILSEEGFDFVSDSDGLDCLLMRACSANRQNRLQNIWNMPNGPKRLKAFYGFPSTLEEANLLFSHDRERVEISFDWLSTSLSSATQRIVDLGCASGTLARIIGLSNPNASVVGVDSAPNLIRIAKAATNPSNVSFHVKTFERLSSSGIFNEFVSACGIEAPFLRGPDWSEIDEFERGHVPQSYQIYLKRAYGRMLSGIRSAACDGSRLRAVLRIPTRIMFATFADIAAAKGWKFVPEASMMLRTSAENFPAAVFIAAEQGGRFLLSDAGAVF